MQQHFPRAVVEELRRRAGQYRSKNKHLVTALIASECKRAGIEVDAIPEEVLGMVDVTDAGDVTGLVDVLKSLRTK